MSQIEIDMEMQKEEMAMENHILFSRSNMENSVDCNDNRSLKNQSCEEENNKNTCIASS